MAVTLTAPAAVRAQAVPVGLTGAVPSTGPVALTGLPEPFGGTGARPQPAPARASARPLGRHPSDGRRCARISSVSTCTTYRGGRAVRVCTRSGPAPERCSAPGAGASVAAAAAGRDEGWWAGPGPSPMGRLWITAGGRARGLCSATLTTPDVVLTAGHCLWNDGAVAPGLPRGYLSAAAPLTFVPGNAFAANGGRDEAQTAVAPRGTWPVTRSYVPTCWTRHHDPHCDIGLAVLGTAGGRAAGEVAGTFEAWANACCVVGEEVVAGGYPAGGPRFATYAGGFGNAPYFCRARLTAHSAVAAGTGSLQLLGCDMSAGASGGPVWTRFTDGRYHVVGINARHGGPGRLAFQPLDEVFAGFYCVVVGC